ncbi:hypothetical protein [Nocardioides sp. CFH 31398]|uniref:hypothetical protein n=1 Tax=Nocardioides sp. CFH 31398 TaxID=2919579 RepID=UPI001F059017|nr:hypothetical protein [Nocardioides sp. CFH 31398]MCH1868970.1 hypothetical protein [Nocardioides sp. CFH 31398]
MDDATWLALTLVLTVVGLAVTVLALRRRGSAPALRALGITLLVPAAYLTDALPLVVRIGQEIGSWAVRLVFSPVVWSGVALGVVGVVLFLVGGSMMARGRGVTARRPAPAAEGADGRPAVGAGQDRAPAGRRGRSARQAPPAQQPADEGMDDIEAILRRRGIE